jgi:hypothetical protein
VRAVLPFSLALCLLGLDGWACPTCLTPRVEPTPTREFTLRGGLRSSFGNDTLAGVTRWELRNELSVGVAYGDGVLDLEVPILYRNIGGESLAGPGDVTARGSVEMLGPAALGHRDWLRLLPAVIVAPGASTRGYLWSLSSQAVTPQLGLGYRHSEALWAVTAVAFAAIPIALEGATFTAGPTAGVGAAFEYMPWRWLSGRVALDFKQQWASRDGGGPLNDTQGTALFAGVEARVSPASQVSIAAAFSQPLFTVSPGAYAYGRVYRLGLELAL